MDISVNLNKPEKKVTSHIAIILDKSGSMGSCREQTISGFNEQIQQIQDTGKDSKVSFVAFNHEVDTVFWNEDPDRLVPITSSDYQPSGSTAMYDAVGYTINRLKDEVGKDDTVLLIIMSDGWENASKKFNQSTLAEMIQERQSTDKWTITYMGANQDLSKISEDLKIKKGNMSSYTSTQVGTADAFAQMRQATAMYNMGSVSPRGFYSAPEEEKEETETK